jgi:dienelactone hydrolase
MGKKLGREKKYMPFNSLFQTISRLVFILILVGAQKSFAQLNCSLSNNGKYLSYTLYDYKKNELCAHVRLIDNTWQRQFEAGTNGVFANNSDKWFVKQINDTLCIQTLGKNDVECIANVIEFRVEKIGFDEFLIYKLRSGLLVFRSIVSKKELRFQNTLGYWLTSNSSIVLFAVKQNDSLQSLIDIDLSDGKSNILFTATAFKDVVKSSDGLRVVFFANSTCNKSIFIFSEIGAKGKPKINEVNIRLDDNVEVDKLLRFSKDNTKIFMTIKERNEVREREAVSKVDIWGYSDKKLQSQQLLQTNANQCLAAIDLESSRTIILNRDNEIVTFSNNDSLAIITQAHGGASEEWNWNISSSHEFILLDIYSGKRKSLSLNYPRFSPDNRFLIGSDSPIENVQNNLISYDLKSGYYKNITACINPVSNEEVSSANALVHKGYGVEMFLPHQNALIIHDRYDLWLVYSNGATGTTCLTNGVGKKSKIIFRVTSFSKLMPIENGDTILLTAFDEKNKRQGFYKLILGQKSQFYPLFMASIKLDFGFPKKARDASVFLVKYESSNLSSQFYISSDLNTFYPVIEPSLKKESEWGKASLISWRDINGAKLQGIVYKPEDFNSLKRYPVIFLFYEEMSDKLNEYLTVQTSHDRINIPWFVKNGYIVCTPDIKYEIGSPGKSALNALVSCAKYLVKFAWVDSKRMALQGHSFGGFETNYIITHSNLFACAVSASGPSDLVSSYGSLIGNGSSGQFISEYHQNRIGGTLWDNPQKYISNSPIFYAPKVSTPLLMMSNKGDKAVSFAQGVEFFTALRRLGKRVWMLQYDDAGHSVYEEIDAMDYTKRMKQFFDHYLKDSACPRWMLYGIPAKDKGIDNGYELVKEKDQKTGKWITPKEGGLLTDEERKRVEALKIRSQ